MADCEDNLEMGVPAAYYDTWNRHDSIAFCNYKGLRNAPGENNCFLNSAVQVFWHLDVFRRSYRRLTGHACMGNSCIFCALKVIFTQFQYSDQSSLPPDTLRKALAETFVDQHRFQLGHMDDAAECFENILRRIHQHLASDHNEDTCTAPHCLSHQKFAMTVFDQLVCPCGAKTDPLRFHEMVHYISANALVSQAKQMCETGDLLHPDRFGLLLRNAAAVGDVRDCPGYCGKQVQIRRTLLNAPDVVSIGLIWDSERPSGELITDVARSLGTTIMLQDVFHSVMHEDVNKLQLVALVCYYGKHYSTFVFHSKLHVWIYFDDATVREIGPRWEDVVQKCVRSRYQPLLLLYTNPKAALLPVDTAPKKTTMQPGYKIHTSQVSPEVSKPVKRDTKAAFAQQRAAAGRRAVTPGPEMDSGRDVYAQRQVRRAVTPGPEHYSRELEWENTTKPEIEHHRHNSFLVAMSSKPETPEAYNCDGPVSLSKLAMRGGNRTSYPNGNPDINHRPDSQTLMGEYVYNNGTVQPSFDRQNKRYDPQADFSTYGENGYGPPPGADPYRLPVNNYDGNDPQVLANGITHVSEVQRKESFKKGNHGPCDVVRYMVDQPRSAGSTNPSMTSQPSGSLDTGRPSRRNHVRTRSQGHEDTISVSSETNPQVHNSAKSRSHPTYGPDGLGKSHHGPVQSGLATLPRKKLDKRSSKSPSPTDTLDLASQLHERQGSASSTGSVVLNPKYQNGDRKPVVPVSNKSEYMDQRHFIRKSQVDSSSGVQHSRHGLIDDVDNHHRRQVSSSSQSSQSTLTPSVCESSHYQDDSLLQHSHRPSTSSQQSNTHQYKPRPGVLPGGAPPHHNKPGPIPEGYISRNMVEKLFARQGLQRQTSSASSMSVKSNTSSSSIESDLFIAKSSKSKGGNKDSLSVEIPYDSVSLESQKDSGYGSSDRNSSSSTSSITMDPFSQYFLSRSMIPPKNVNDYAFMQNYTDSVKESIENMEKEDALHESPYEPVEYKTQPPNQYTVNYVQQHSQHVPNGSSYTDLKYGLAARPTSDNHKGHPNSQYSNQKSETSSGHPRYESPVQNGNQICSGENSNNTRGGGNNPSNKDLINFHSGIQVNDILPGYNEVMGGGTDEFLNLCHKAEEMMDSCMLSETSDTDNSNAVNYCNTAIAYLNQAMHLPSVSQQSYVFAQRKHNSCVMKYRSLLKRSPTNLEGNISSAGSTETLNSCSANRSSMTSTDSETSQRDLIHLDGQSKTQKDVLKEKLHDLYKHTGKTAPSMGQQQQNCPNRLPNGKPAPPLRTCSVVSSAVKPNGVPTHNSPSQNVSVGDKSTNSAINSDQRNNIASMNNTNGVSASTCRYSKQAPELSNLKDAELYQAYVNRQKALHGGAVQGGMSSQTSSGTSTPTSSVEGSEGGNGSIMPGGPSQLVRYSKAEIRQILQQNMLNRHGTGTPVPGSVIPGQGGQPQPYQGGQPHQRGKLSQGPPIGRPDPNLNSSSSSVPEQSQPSNLVRPAGVKLATIKSQRTTCLPSGAPRGPKPQIACKPPVISDSQSKGMLPPKSGPSSMPPPTQPLSDYQTREFIYGGKSCHLERCSSQPDCNNLYDQQACHSDYSYLDTALLARERASRSAYSSQPDLTSSGMMEANPTSLPLPASLSAPSTPVHSCENLQDIDGVDSKPSVRDIASRFEVSMGGARSNGRMEADFESVPTGPHRQRSKSESSSSPKPVLIKKRKKPKARRPRKSVTFSDSIALIAASEELPPGPAPPPYEEAIAGTKCQDKLGWDDRDTYYGYDSDDDIVKVVPAGYADEDRDSCASTESPTDGTSKVMCTLCRKKGAELGVSYCSNCQYYMSRFQSR